MFERNKENHTAEELFLSKIKHLPIESIKISNRIDGYEYLDKCLDAYINGRIKEYIEENKRNYRLFGRTAVFNHI